MKYQVHGNAVPSKWVMVNCDMPEDERQIHAVLLRYFRLFDHKSASVFYDPAKGLYWFLDSESEPYAVVCGVRALKVGAVLS